MKSRQGAVKGRIEMAVIPGRPLTGLGTLMKQVSRDASWVVLGLVCLTCLILGMKTIQFSVVTVSMYAIFFASFLDNACLDKKRDDSFYALKMTVGCLYKHCH